MEIEDLGSAGRRFGRGAAQQNAATAEHAPDDGASQAPINRNYDLANPIVHLRINWGCGS